VPTTSRPRCRKVRRSLELFCPGLVFVSPVNVKFSLKSGLSVAALLLLGNVRRSLELLCPR
jgi:hypothetical protein